MPRPGQLLRPGQAVARVWEAARVKAGRFQGQRAKLAGHIVACFWTIIEAVLQGHPVGLGRPKAFWATKTSKVEFRGPDSAARKAFRGHGRIQGAMEDANMVHNRHQSTLRHTFG